MCVPVDTDPSERREENIKDSESGRLCGTKRPSCRKMKEIRAFSGENGKRGMGEGGNKEEKETSNRHAYFQTVSMLVGRGSRRSFSRYGRRRSLSRFPRE